MKTEFLVPILYSLKRYKIRQCTSWYKSVIGFVSSLLRDYLWVPIYAIFMVGGPNWTQITGIILHLLTFSIAYEMGYIYTDTISILKEDKDIRKVIYQENQPFSHIYTALGIRLIFLAGFLYLIQFWLNWYIVGLYLLILSIYFVYGNLSEKWRTPLFVILRYLKGFIPYAFLLIQLPRIQFVMVFLVTLSTAIFFSIEYFSRKFKIEYINIQLLKYIWVRYLIVFIFFAPYVLLNHIPFREFSLLFTIYVGVNLTMISFTLIRRLLEGEGLKEILNA